MGGGGGGGASDVREGYPGTEDGSLDTRLIVAGGGGGSGNNWTKLVEVGGAGVPAAMRDRTAATVRRAVLSPEAQAGRRAARATAEPGAAQTASPGRWGRAATAEVTTVAVAAAATTAVAAAGISYSPVLVPLGQQGVEAAAPT